MLEQQVRALVRCARDRHPAWPEWCLLMRPETFALLGDAVHPGPLRPSDGRHQPGGVRKLDGCEIAVADLIADFVIIAPADHGRRLSRWPPSYWLDLVTGRIAEWTQDDNALGRHPESS